jgi:type VI secretion system protein ImpJ
MAVPQYRERGLNVATSTRQGSARYRAEIELFRDENTGLSEKPVQVARKNLRLLVDGESLDGFSRCRGADRAPGGDVPAEPRFFRRCSISRRRLPAESRANWEILTARRRDGLRRRRIRVWPISRRRTSPILLLYTVNSAFPQFRHLFGRGRAPRSYRCSRWPGR